MEDSKSLRKTSSGSIAARGGVSYVGDLERALLKVFPAEDACSWDRTGLSVGDPRAQIEGVVVALDPTVATMRSAVEIGANVLVTHHPLFLDPPDCFMPFDLEGQTSGAGVHFALTHGLCCMAFHTACDVSRKGLAVLPGLLRLKTIAPLDPLPHDPTKGFACVCVPDGESLDLKHLAARCVSVFEMLPRVWGASSTRLERIAVCGGSASDSLQMCLSASIDCLVCGEVKYHDALNARESGLCIIELGHDVSERPLCALLASEIIAAGVDESCITILNQPDNWSTPESIRR